MVINKKKTKRQDFVRSCRLVSLLMCVDLGLVE